MKIGYFCYRLSGTGPRTRAADIINGIASTTDHEIVVLTNEPEKITANIEVRAISLSDPISTLRTTRKYFADADVVHVPINVYQVLFVRLAYHGPLVAGVGPGIQPSLFHRYLGRLLGIDVKIKGHEVDDEWDNAGYDTAVCTATIDRSQFYPFKDSKVKELREQRDFDDDDIVVLYVGKLSKGQGAHIISQMAKLSRDDDSIHYIVAGNGPMKNTFRDRDDLIYEGFVDNKSTPALYNLADVTVAPRKGDKTSNVGLESISCGTPMITTATGLIELFFKDRGTYLWADRDSQSVLKKVHELMSDSEYYESQRERGLNTMEEMDLTLETAMETHLQVYRKLADEH